MKFFIVFLVAFSSTFYAEYLGFSAVSTPVQYWSVPASWFICYFIGYAIGYTSLK